MHTKQSVAFWAQVLCKHVFTDGNTLSADDVERIEIACHQIIKELGQVKDHSINRIAQLEKGVTGVLSIGA